MLSGKSFDELADSPFICSPTLKHNTYESNNTLFHIWFQGEVKPDWDKIINDFVYSTVAPTNTLIGQIARWEKRICPLTIGLTPAFNAFVTARVKEVAPLSLSERNGMLIVDLGEAHEQMERGASVKLLRVVKQRTVAIGRGENRGREVTYTNVVRSIVRLGFWTGAPARFEIPLPEARADDADGYVVIVQKTWGDTLGPILAASKGGALKSIGFNNAAGFKRATQAREGKPDTRFHGSERKSRFFSYF